MDVKNRICDIIHGPSTPSLQSCLDEGEIPWAQSSSMLLLFEKIQNVLLHYINQMTDN